MGNAVRRLIMFLWLSASRVMGARLRARLRGEVVAGRRKRHDPDADSVIEPEALSLPRSEAPLVSVIIPTYGQVQFTLRCLASIQAHEPAAAIEVIVIDDAFAGPETACLSRISGIHLVRNETNLGFIRTCNAAAGMARGTFLLFLNNDTLVLPGWLDRMIEVFETRPDAGIVGSKLLGEDGTLR